jgi:hypothetical protein
MEVKFVAYSQRDTKVTVKCTLVQALTQIIWALRLCTGTEAL